MQSYTSIESLVTHYAKYRSTPLVAALENEGRAGAGGGSPRLRSAQGAPYYNNKSHHPYKDGGGSPTLRASQAQHHHLNAGFRPHDTPTPHGFAAPSASSPRSSHSSLAGGGTMMHQQQQQQAYAHPHAQPAGGGGYAVPTEVPPAMMRWPSHGHYAAAQALAPALRASDSSGSLVLPPPAISTAGAGCSPSLAPAPAPLASLPLSPLSSASPGFRPSSLSAGAAAYDADWRALQAPPALALASPDHRQLLQQQERFAPQAARSPFATPTAGHGGGGGRAMSSGSESTLAGDVSGVASLSPAGSEAALTPRSEGASTSSSGTAQYPGYYQPQQQMQQQQQQQTAMAMMAPPSPLILGRPGSSSGGRHGATTSGPFIVSSSGQAVTFTGTATNVSRGGQVVPLHADDEQQHEEEDSFLREAFSTAATQLAQLTLQQVQQQH